LEKLDGSMVFAFAVAGSLGFGTKAGMTNVASAAWRFAEGSSQPHIDLCELFIREGYTPVFEWCSVASCLKVVHQQDSLVLTACRHLVRGHYMPYSQMQELAEIWGVPVVGPRREDSMVKEGKFRSGSALAEYMYNCQGIEGAVLVMNDGRRVKFKTYWWRHRLNEAERRLSSDRVKEMRQLRDDRVHKQQCRGRHRSVRGMVMGEIRKGLQYYRRHCEGVTHMIRLKERSGKAVKLFLIFGSQQLRDKAVATIHKDSDDSYFRVVVAKSNRVHCNEKWGIEYVYQ
jgi:hypothetical protein